ncbi:MAG TPA: PHB depolymerase family esterase [Candidatus Omnitrophota bacterium]|nr:PHB depolymerase family esterase [Candidatus Omnitrophota bacterium]
MKSKIAAACFVITAILWNGSQAMASFYGEVKTGLQFVQVTDKTSYFIYVPKTYKGDKVWPLIIGLDKFGSGTKKYAEAWIKEADKRGYVVLCPNWYKAREFPMAGDKWFFKTMRSVAEQYSIDPKRVLLTGFNDGGDYAYYLALREPKRFSGVAVIGGGLTPSYGAVAYLGRIKRHPIPVYVLVGENEKPLKSRDLSVEGIREGVKKLQSAGVPAELWQNQRANDIFDQSMISKILDWFEKTSGGGIQKERKEK